MGNVVKLLVGTVLVLLFQALLVSLLWFVHPLSSIFMLLLLLNDAVILFSRQERQKYIAGMRKLW